MVAIIGRIRGSFNYIDEQGFSEPFLKDSAQSEIVYREVSKELRHKIDSNKITPRQAEIIQVNIAFVIRIAHGEQVAHFIVENAVKFSGNVTVTAPREIKELKYAYNIYKSLAEELTILIVKEKNFPFLLKLPDYTTYLFPYATHRVTPYCNRPTYTYNHELGRLATDQEYFKKCPEKKEAELRENLKRSTKRLRDANLDPRAKCRRALAATAMQSYQMLFMMLTGAYASEIAQLKFDGQLEFEKSVTNKSYRAIKLRAAGRIVQYDLAAGSVSLFRRYLKLREWVLDGRKESFLFFGLQVKSWLPVPVCESAIRNFQRNKIIGIFMPQNFEMLTARQFRKTKSLFLHEQQDIDRKTVADVLNHSEETNERSYMEVSPEKARDELTSYWEAVHEASSHIQDVESEKSCAHKPIAAGHCDDYQHPEPAIESPPIEPDCRKQYGCLFCIHYICHANDKEDIHKLFSLLYIVTGVLNSVADTNKAKDLFLMLSARVKNILLQIKMKSKTGSEKVDEIGERVFKLGELTPYWENRLQRYEALGLIFIESQEWEGLWKR
ncbi:hypothetical protein AT251_18335 [Enterovibrio nigricans]|nr:hypothetical protein [Enterovibrio nigricans]PKF49506.1 hypothetical protein AT251_18335 [Enterovibrio nigricans]